MDRLDKPGKIASRCRFAAVAGRWITNHPIAVAAVVLFVAVAGPFVWRRHSEWTDVYVRAAHHLRAGESVYQLGEGYVYPPFMAVLVVPFTYLSMRWSLIVWYLINVAATILLFRYAWKLPSGDAMRADVEVSRQSWSMREWIIMLLGSVCAIRFVSDCLTHQQTDLVIAAALMAACAALCRSRTWLGATLLGAAAGAKCTPLLWCAFLLWRRQWLAAGWLVIVAGGVNLIPNLISTPEPRLLHLADWFQQFLAPLSHSPFYPYSDQIYNQSLCGAVNRWYTTGWEWTGGRVALVAHGDPTGPTVLKAGAYVVNSMLVLLVLCLSGNHRRAESTGRPDREVWRHSAMLLLMVICSPMSSKSHFCLLLLPGFCVARYAVETQDRVATGLLAAAIGIGTVGIRGLVGEDVATLALWYGNVMWSALFLFAACVYVLSSEAGETDCCVAYPLMTPIGRIRATLRDRPARSTTSTTSSTFL